MASYKQSTNNSIAYLLDGRTILACAEQRALELEHAARKRAARRILAARARSRAQRAALEVDAKTRARNLTKLLGNAERESYIRRAKEESLELAISLAERILRRELSQSAESLAREITSTIESLLDCTRIQIFVNPQDYVEVSLFLKGVFGLPLFTLDQDDLVELGDCRIETSSGSIEICWRRDLQLLADEVRGEFERTNS